MSPGPDPSGTPLVIGYGNVLRGDDGVGWQAAQLLAADERMVGAIVMARHQLLPELALDVGAAAVVVFVDASVLLPAGTVASAELGAGGIGEVGSHHLTPATLLALARELGGAAPQAFVVSVGVQSLEVGDRLSAAVVAALPQVVDVVVGLVSPMAGAARV